MPKRDSLMRAQTILPLVEVDDSLDVKFGDENAVDLETVAKSYSVAGEMVVQLTPEMTLEEFEDLLKRYQCRIVSDQARS